MEGSADVPLELLPCVRERTEPLGGKCASTSGHGTADEIIIKAFLFRSFPAWRFFVWLVLFCFVFFFHNNKC